VKLVDWQIAESEKHEEWEVRNTLLVERGARPRTDWKPSSVMVWWSRASGWKLVYAQSVIASALHLLGSIKNVRDKSRTELKGDDHQEQRRQ